MFGNTDLDQVHRYQEQLRRDTARNRLVANPSRSEPRTTKARRIFGLRLSLA